MILFIFLVLTGLVYGKPSCIHNNQDRLTAKHVIDQVVRDADHDRNGVVSIFEIISAFVSRFDLYPRDMRIDRYEFIYTWGQIYRDVPDFSEYLFNHLDRNHNKLFGSEDIPLLYDAIDANKDGTVTNSEFRRWFEILYRDCVPVPVE